MRGTILFLAGLTAALGAGWIAFPKVLYRHSPQPVDFSHKVHAEKAGQKCEDCHAFRDDGSFAGIPSLEKCSGCHAAAMGTTAAEKNFIEHYVTPNREPEWQDYAQQPENVWFSHATHVKRASMKCETCHGSIGSAGTLPAYRVDPVSGYSRDVMSMDACVNCHWQKGTEHSCLDCHK